MRSNSDSIAKAIASRVDVLGGTFADDGINIRVETLNYSIVTGYTQARKARVLNDILKKLKSTRLKEVFKIIIGLPTKIQPGLSLTIIRYWKSDLSWSTGPTAKHWMLNWWRDRPKFGYLKRRNGQRYIYLGKIALCLPKKG